MIDHSSAGLDAVHLGPNTMFLSLTFADLQPVVSGGCLPELLRGVDAVEFRVDLLRDHRFVSASTQRHLLCFCSEEFVRAQLALLRKSTWLPVVYTGLLSVRGRVDCAAVRSKSQGGAFPDNEQAYFALLDFGLRSGCEFIDLERCCFASMP